jgi:hypothetical protein
MTGNKDVVKEWLKGYGSQLEGTTTGQIENSISNKINNGSNGLYFIE